MRPTAKYLANFRASFITLYSKWRRETAAFRIYSSLFLSLSEDFHNTRRASKTGRGPGVVIVKINLTLRISPCSDPPLGPCGLTQFPRCRCKPPALAADVKSTLHETTTFGPRERDVQAANPDH